MAKVARTRKGETMEANEIPTRPSWFAHPYGTAVVFIVGLLGAWLFATLGRPGSFWPSIFVGFAVGVPATAALKYIMWRTVDTYVAELVPPGLPRSYGRNLLRTLPLLLFYMIAMVMLLAFHIGCISGYFVLALLYPLVYPEQRNIYRAACARREELRRAAPSGGDTP